MWTREDYNRIIEEECGREPKYLARFWAYHDANRVIWKRLIRAAKRLEAEGRERFGVKWQIEHIRWESAIKTRDPDDEDLKLNDHYTAYYARLLIHARPSLGELIELRTLGGTNPKRDGVTYWNGKKALSHGRVLRYLWQHNGDWPDTTTDGGPARKRHR